MSSSRGSNPQNGRGISLNSMLLISVAIHVLILSSGAFLKMSSTPRLTFGPVYAVQLVNTPASLTEATPASSLSKDITAADSRDRSSVLRKQSDALGKVPIRRAESTSSRNPQVDQALDRIRKKAAAETSANAQTGVQQDRQTSSSSDSRLNDYYRSLWSRIKSQWALPPGILPKGSLEAIVHVRILRNGSLMDIGLEKRSGNSYFDNSALRAVNKSNPLPPLPEWFRDSSLDIGIRFHSSELM